MSAGHRWVWVAAAAATVCAAAVAGGCAAWVICAVDAQQAREGNPTRRTDTPRSTP